MTSIESSYSISGSGPAVIFVHGIGARKSAWDKVIVHLENHFTCISYDLRGHGDSPRGDFPYSLKILVEDIETLRLKLNLGKIHIVGHSLGGMKFTTSVNKPLNIYARTGLIFWDVDFKVSGSGTLTYNGSTYNSNSFLKVDGSDPYLGLGLSYKTNDRSSLSFDYHTLASTNAIQGAAFNISSYSISWLLNF